MDSNQIEEIKQAIRESSENTSVYIGCDSRLMKSRSKPWEILYVTVVILHYDSSKGAKLFKFIDRQRDFGSLRMRLMNEVYMATGIGYELLDVIGDRHLEIHLDLNASPTHKSNVVVKEAMGYVMGVMGQKPKIKPEAFAASAVADHFT